MQKQKVAIVGGGFAGLVCAYKLAKSGGDAYDISIYEKDNFLGGRLFDIFAGRVIVERWYPHTLWFTKELGLFNKLEKMSLDTFGLLTPDKQVVTANNAAKHMMKEIIFVKKSLKLFFKTIQFFRFITKIEYNIGERTSNVDPALRAITFADWMQQYPDYIQKRVLIPSQFMNYKQLDKMSAETGLLTAGAFYSPNVMYYFGSAPKAYGEAFNDACKKLDIKISLNSELTKLEKNGDGYLLRFNDGRELQADIVVLALPTPPIEKLIGKFFGISYTWDRGLLIKGKFKHPNIKLFTSAAYDTNIRLIYNWGEYQVYYLIDPGERIGDTYEVHDIGQKFPDITFLYEEGKYEFVREFVTPYAMPLHFGKKAIDIKQGNNLYICGDFYCHSGLESAAASAVKVAESIIGDTSLHVSGQNSRHQVSEEASLGA